MPHATPLLRDIRLGTDLDELVSLRPDRTMTTWDPEFFHGAEAFWLHGVGNRNASAFVVAARLFHSINPQEELETLRVFYLNPKNRQDQCEVRLGSGIGQVKGNFGHTGNLFVFPAFRGRGIPAIATRALHREILSRWDVDWIFGLQEKELAYKGLWQDQGYPHCEGQVIWDHNVYGQRFDMKLVYGSRDEISQTL